MMGGLERSERKKKYSLSSNKVREKEIREVIRQEIGNSTKYSARGSCRKLSKDGGKKRGKLAKDNQTDGGWLARENKRVIGRPRKHSTRRSVALPF